MKLFHGQLVLVVEASKAKGDITVVAKDAKTGKLTGNVMIVAE